MPNLNSIHFYDFFFKRKNVLVCYPHEYTEEDRQTVRRYGGSTVLVISEPIKSRPLEPYKRIYEDYSEEVFDINFGCVTHDPARNKFKFPLYLLQNDFPIFKDYQALFRQANAAVQQTTLNALEKKDYCSLINSWDPDNVRTCIFEKLNRLKSITCPGKLFNNCSKKKLNQVGKATWIKNFVFNICAENYDYGNIDGYITEKLMDACLGHAIPIYAGWFDAYDERIFNKQRILFYNSRDQASIEAVVQKVQHLLTHPAELCAFYQQPIFCETAFETIEMLKQDINQRLGPDLKTVKAPPIFLIFFAFFAFFALTCLLSLKQITAREDQA